MNLNFRIILNLGIGELILSGIVAWLTVVTILSNGYAVRRGFSSLPGCGPFSWGSFLLLFFSVQFPFQSLLQVNLHYGKGAQVKRTKDTESWPLGRGM